MKKIETIEECTRALLPVRDVLDILSGKWKLQIIISLTFDNLRFGEMQNHISGITPKMLAKELKELEINELVKRTVYDSSPVSIIYSITPYGRSLKRVIAEIEDWGIKHRKRIMKN